MVSRDTTPGLCLKLALLWSTRDVEMSNAVGQGADVTAQLQLRLEGPIPVGSAA
jgi:hypothetical protein